MTFFRSLEPWVLAVALAGCSEPSTKSAGPELHSGSGAEAITIKFSDPGNAGPLAYGKREGIFERELAKVNAKIEWVPGPGAFSASFEAMNSGAINASGAAVSPIVGALAHNLPFRIFSISDPAEMRQAGVIVPKGSSVRNIRELVGKRVAVNWAAHGDYVLLRALQKHGVDPKQVARVPIQPPDAAAAFATGKIDAWSTFGVFYATAVRNGAHVLARESEIGSDDVGVTSAHISVLKKNPEAFETFVRVHQDLVRIGHREPEKFQNVFTDKGPKALSGELLRVAIEETRDAPVPRIPTEDDRERVGKVATLLFDNKSIDKNIAVDEIVFDVSTARKKAAQ